MTKAELCLSKDEVRQLTRTPQKARQLEFLRKNGIRHYLDGYGWPVVLRSAVGEPVRSMSIPAWKSNKL